MSMKIEEETRKFRGKEITVIFSEYKSDIGAIEFNACVCLSIENYIFIGNSSFKPIKEVAYEEAIKRLENNLSLCAKGEQVKEAESDVSAAQDELTYRMQEQNTARWFLEFTKDRVEQ